MGYNHIHICGNLGRDPEVKTTQAGKTMVRLSVAVTKRYNNQDNTTWFKVVAFGELAERCARSLVKGCKLSVHGEMEARSYQHNGENRVDWSVLMRGVEFHTRPDRNQQPKHSTEYKPSPSLQEVKAESKRVEVLDPWTWDKTETPAQSDYKWETNPSEVNSFVNQPWRNNPK
tara:strand:- start:144 stop:662 length:519 start_codon:yes stop_codon:yes gene_type:complete